MGKKKIQFMQFKVSFWKEFIYYYCKLILITYFIMKTLAVGEIV